MSKWPVEKKVFSGFTLALVVLVVIGSLAFYNGAMVIASQRRVVHTQEVLAQLGVTYSTVQDAETSQRGYLLTGDGSYLEPYHAAIQQVDPHLAELRDLTRDNPSQNARVRDLKDLIARRLGTLEETLNLRETEGYDAAVRNVSSGRGARQMAAVRAMVAEIEAEERRLLTERTDASEASSRATILASVLSVALVAILLAVAYRLIKRDMRDRKRIEVALQESEERFRRLSNASREGVCIHDNGKILDVNKRLAEMFGYEPHEVIGMSMWDFTLSEYRDTILNKALMEDETPYELVGMRKDGSLFPIEVHGQTVPYQGRKARVTTTRDLTEQKRAQEALQLLATQDALTGLLNRHEMDRLLAEEVIRCRRYGRSMSLIMIDIDHFKSVNDRYGHVVGDEVLRWAGGIFRNGVRSTDKVARYGGEEIVAILPETGDREACRVAERFRSAVSADPFTYTAPSGEVVSIPITISVGVAELPGHALTADSLLVAADSALYHAKRSGRNQVVSYTVSSHAAVELLAR
ncbi:MAG: diguanylate cyclase [Chloroflexota bacterium]|nr:diguanylate cyclase [Chloroflexota bacterium]